MIARARIVDEARAWIGTRWQHQACVKGIACDCIGLVVGVARELGIPEALAYLEAPQFRNYGRQPDRRMLLEACATFLRAKPEPEAGDILLMRFGTEPQHFAITTGPTIIHAFAQRRRVCEHSIDRQWRERVVAVYSYRGV